MRYCIVDQCPQQAKEKNAYPLKTWSKKRGGGEGGTKKKEKRKEKERRKEKKNGGPSILWEPVSHQQVPSKDNYGGSYREPEPVLWNKAMEQYS